MENIIKAKVYRYNPDRDKEPYFQNYEVPINRRVTIHELLNIIHRDLDGTLAFRTYKCYKGSCSLCVVKLNGRVVKSCSTPVEPGDKITIEPAGGGDIIRDLVVDFNVM